MSSPLSTDGINMTEQSLSINNVVVLDQELHVLAMCIAGEIVWTRPGVDLTQRLVVIISHKCLRQRATLG